MATIPSNKRQRTADQSLHISNLPDGILAHAASYLAQPSMALFAVAMTSPSKSWTKDNFTTDSEHQQTVASIISSGVWDALDFEDIDATLAHKLSDDDLQAVLKCINAQDALKKLKLSGCNITGRCLELLRGSTTIEHIDLSIAKQFESPQLDYNPLILEEVVIPILDSIISTNGTSLKYLLLPNCWTHSTSDIITAFNRRYTNNLQNHGLTCSYCNEQLDEENSQIRHFQDCVCYVCLKIACNTCSNFEGHCFMGYCNTCEKDYCIHCVSVEECARCSDHTCKCCVRVCRDCDEKICPSCAEKEGAYCLGDVV